jgi:hypothetical protein
MTMEETMNLTILDRAVDLPAQRRPGVPAQREPHVVGGAHWATPEQQTPAEGLTVDPQREGLTATFGTGQPPHGLSGALRRAAYRWPDYEARRWAVLLLADRVDAMEDRARVLLRSPLAWAGLFTGALVVSTRIASRRRSLLARVF